jgi:hypothetical protein
MAPLSMCTSAGSRFNAQYVDHIKSKHVDAKRLLDQYHLYLIIRRNANLMLSLVASTAPHAALSTLRSSARGEGHLHK